jgi:hypothetical protein
MSRPRSNEFIYCDSAYFPSPVRGDFRRKSPLTGLK